jgi:hypothetical protein
MCCDGEIASFFLLCVLTARLRRVSRCVMPAKLHKVPVFGYN